MTFARVTRRKRNLATAGAVLFATAGTALFVGPQAHAATNTGTSTQTVAIVPTGVLTITAPTLSTQTGVNSLTGMGLGPVVVTDSLADSTDWSATVASSNCTASGVTGAASIPADALELDPSGTASSASVPPTVSLDATPGNAASATVPGGPTPFSNPTGSNTYGAGLTLASTSAYGGGSTDPVANDGTYTLSPTLSTGSSFLGVAGATYTCTLQYTVTG